MMCTLFCTSRALTTLQLKSEEVCHQKIGSKIGDGGQRRGWPSDSQWKDLPHYQPTDWPEADLRTFA